MGLGLFSSNRITRKKLMESLRSSFDVGHKSLAQGLIQIFEGKIEINDEQKRELMIVAMLAVSEATYSAFGRLAEEKEIAGKKAREAIFHTEETEQLEQLFDKRSKEYREVLRSENTELVVQFGQIFCAHFLKLDNYADVEVTPQNFKIMMFVGMIFVNQMIGVKKFLDEVMEKCVLDL